jgi:hypothetical protein
MTSCWVCSILSMMVGTVSIAKLRPTRRNFSTDCGAAASLRACPELRNWREMPCAGLGQVAGCQGEAGPFVEVAGERHRVERLDAGPKIGDGLGAAVRLYGDGEVQGTVGVVHCGVEVAVVAGECGPGRVP